jgi:hypothetical protein
MRRLLIAVTIAAFTMTAQAQVVRAQEESSSGWRMVAVGVGALAGIWAVNVATAGFAAGPTIAVVSDMAAGNIGVAQVATIPVNVGSALVANPWWTVTRVALMTGGAISGGYIAGWLYDG